MSTCPYCGTTYHSTYPPISLSARQRAIYDAVAAGGEQGAPVHRLLHAVYGDEQPPSAWGVLRVNVFEINQRIRDRGQRIRGRRDLGYVLINDGAILGDE